MISELKVFAKPGCCGSAPAAGAPWAVAVAAAVAAPAVAPAAAGTAVAAAAAHVDRRRVSSVLPRPVGFTNKEHALMIRWSQHGPPGGAPWAG